jgi:hypothetical protein
MRQAIATLPLALMALLSGAPSWAGAAAGSFAVGITLNNPSGQPQSRPGVCYSRTLSEQTRARVEVNCATGEFVAIEAVPGVPFLGVHGGAFRYAIPLVAEATALDAGEPASGQGTITMYRVYDLTQPEGPGNLWWDRPVEMRVSF